MKRFLFGFLLLLMSFLTTACFGGSAKERIYFSMDYMIGSEQKVAQRDIGTVIVQNFTSSNAFDRQELVYRSNPYEFKYYWYKLWASKPRKMLQELYTKHLRQTGIFTDVSLTIEDQMPDFSMDVEIIAIEELDVSDTEWYAHLALRMALTHYETGATVWDYAFDVRRPVSNNEPVYVVKAMSELLDEELQKAFRELDQTITSGKLAQRMKNSHKKEVRRHEFGDTQTADDILFEPEIEEEKAIPNESLSNRDDVPKASLKVQKKRENQ